MLFKICKHCIYHDRRPLLLSKRDRESKNKKKTTPCNIGDKPTSDVVVRLRTEESRDDRFYCHSHIIIEKSTYFAERLSDKWPTCQILDSRNCVEVYCQESDFDHHVTVLRLLYVAEISVSEAWNGVKNALGILQVAVKLGCPQIVCACVDYLEAMPWEEAEEDEILRIIPGLGSNVKPILARLHPVNPSTVRLIFLSAVHFATSSPPPSMNELKFSTQEQLEYMLTEDDDAPLLTADEEIKSQVGICVKSLLIRFYDLLEPLLCEPKEGLFELDELTMLKSILSDLAWACQILSKMETMKELVHSWVDASEKIVKAVKGEMLDLELLETRIKVVEVSAKVLEAIAYGSVILATAKRLHVVKVWLPFVRVTKSLVDDAISTNDEDNTVLKTDSELWQSIESAFVSMILALPSIDQAEILSEWLESEYIKYPDLTEAFEVWCYRSKVSKRRMASLRVLPGM
ncbi:hypothetical protein Scep_003436 [Stephania cephalantha]|uniref:BTB domain-containing protein n=1 Tax=Stephania cephalantha TaxID=152367 RepID=A0AAP0PUD8_9MAGN